MVTGQTSGFVALPFGSPSASFFVLGRFVDLDFLETNDIYRRKADLEILVSKLYDMMDIN